MNEDTTRDRILQTAGPIFAERGYREATVRDICDQADVNLASVNYYFGDKAKLYVEAVKYARETNTASAGSIGAMMAGGPEEQLFGFVRALLSKLGIDNESNWQTKLLIREFMDPGDATREIVEAYFRPYFQRLLGLLRQLSNQTITDDQLLKAGFSVIGQCLYYRVAAPVVAMFVSEEVLQREFDAEQIARHITDFSLAAVSNLKRASSNPVVASQSEID